MMVNGFSSTNLKEGITATAVLTRLRNEVVEEGANALNCLFNGLNEATIETKNSNSKGVHLSRQKYTRLGTTPGIHSVIMFGPHLRSCVFINNKEPAVAYHFEIERLHVRHCELVNTGSHVENWVVRPVVL